jgi:hypothetical protein
MTGEGAQQSATAVGYVFVAESEWGEQVGRAAFVVLGCNRHGYEREDIDHGRSRA